MKTYKHITDNLERAITANALCTFRRMKDIATRNFTTKWYVFVSSLNGVLDQCYIDTETRSIHHIEYRLHEGKKVVSKEILLRPE